jgi:hypothetical protein
MELYAAYLVGLFLGIAIGAGTKVTVYADLIAKWKSKLNYARPQSRK